ncbi:response regulator [Sulfurimonas sp. SAG-AH-194-C21]|nr:response regulator [Sulfurimonas sp. SAG-AH-194-C21]MDF1883939.1 response regulator [Sulfurimonas sp. SAG-AH-194-C21]
MSKLLIVEDSIIVQAVFKEMLDAINNFDYDLVSTYKEAKKLLDQRRYEYGVVERILPDAPNGEIIALFNKHYLAPLVFTKTIDEDFFDDFEGAHIVEYIQKIKHNNEAYVLKKLLQLQENKQKTILLVSDSNIFGSYLKQNLNLHSFKVFSALNTEQAYEKLSLHPETSLLIIDSAGAYVNTKEIVSYAKAHQLNPDLKILVLVEETNSYETSELLSAGADDFLVKDFSRSEFYVRVYQNINKLC